MTAARLARATSAALTAVALVTPLRAQVATTPEAFFGHAIGADYVLPDYAAMIEFWRALERESERIRLFDLGETAEGRIQYMAIVTSPENHADLQRYREIAERLARAEGLAFEDASALAREGKAVVWIDGGLHANEVLGAQQLMETVYQLVSRTDEETLRILQDVIVLAVHANPDGHDLVSSWYTRHPDAARRTLANLPRLYQKYIGHDNNRDFYMATQPETRNMNRQLFHVWYPQIVYNHHQTAPAGTVMFAPPFRDPFNYRFHPLIVTGIDLVGAAMHNRFISEEKPGVTMRSGASYSTWWNGGLRTTVYFHNMIGLLTETIGSPTPTTIPFLASRQLPRGDLPLPVEPQVWPFRRSVDYSVTANYAVLDVASRFRETFLLNIYRMGRAAIEKGMRDTWTISPSRLEELRADLARSGGAATGDAAGWEYALLRRPEWRDPRAYVLPADQRDFPTAVHLVNALRKAGVVAHRATRPFQVGDRLYPAGSFVLLTAQAFAPHLLDMFEPQDHPHDFLYPSGPPVPPYDAAGWTLAFQMGVEFDRVLDPFEVSLEEVVVWDLQPPPGALPTGPAAAYLLSSAFNDAAPAAVRLAASGERVYRIADASTAAAGGLPPGSLLIVRSEGAREQTEVLARELGLSFAASSTLPSAEQLRVSVPRIALWDRYGGSIPSGWARWILEQRQIPHEIVYAPDLDGGGLRDRFDVIVFPAGAIPQPGTAPSPASHPEEVPDEYRGRLGNVTAGVTIPALREFLESGGSIIAIGTSTAIAAHLGLPIRAQLEDPDGRPLSRQDFYVPGSLLQVAVDTTHPSAWGMPQRADVFFDQAPVFALDPGAEAHAIRPIAWFDSPTPLRSGWAWGQHHLENGIAALSAPVGAGTLYLFGPDILYRGQAHGTFKLFLNSLINSAAQPEAIR